MGEEHYVGHLTQDLTYAKGKDIFFFSFIMHLLIEHWISFTEV